LQTIGFFGPGIGKAPTGQIRLKKPFYNQSTQPLQGPQEQFFTTISAKSQNNTINLKQLVI
jgi:hypothetical protein